MSELGQSFADSLLLWYDKAHRKLPWRVSPDNRAYGAVPDPYRIWLSEVMLQQTQVATVIPYFEKFMAKWPDIHALASADEAEIMAAWAGLGYYSRARNLIACAQIVSGDLGGDFPADEEALQKLPGIGPYTAAAIAAIAFDRPATVVDGNIERVMARLHAVKAQLPGAKPVLRGLAAEATPKQRAGDYAQALMDLGATICKPGKPDCADCPVRGFCQGQKAGIAASLPRREKQKTKPVRHGHVWVALRSDGSVLTVTRPSKGLLGGMLALPSSDWLEVLPEPDPPIVADWQALPATVRHTFTHFHLELRVHLCPAGQADRADVSGFKPAIEFDPDHMPTVFRKAWRLATS